MRRRIAAFRSAAGRDVGSPENMSATRSIQRRPVAVVVQFGITHAGDAPFDTGRRCRGRSVWRLRAFHHLGLRVGFVVEPAQMQHAVHHQVREVVRWPVCAALPPPSRRPARRSRRRRAAARRRRAPPRRPRTTARWSCLLCADNGRSDRPSRRHRRPGCTGCPSFTDAVERGARPAPQQYRRSAAPRRSRSESQLGFWSSSLREPSLRGRARRRLASRDGVVVARIRFDDSLHQRMTHDVLRREVRERQPFDAVEHARSRRSGPERTPRGRSICVMSPVITAVEPKPMRVRNIFICSMVVFWLSSRMMKALFSVRPRMNASGATSMTLRSMYLCDAFDAHHFVQRVVQRAQIRIDLLREVAGQKAELFAGFDGRTHQQNPADALHARAPPPRTPPPDTFCRCRPDRCRSSRRAAGSRERN